MLNEKEKELKVAVREIDLSKKTIQEIMENKNGTVKEPEIKMPASQASALSSAYKDMDTKTSKPEQQYVEAASEIIAFNSFSSINNSEILSLYNQGKSVIEISKLLGLGQGEVKLVIDLFKGKK
jgi:DNA-binding NarL/FixJ family response regulator